MQRRLTIIIVIFSLFALFLVFFSTDNVEPTRFETQEIIEPLQTTPPIEVSPSPTPISQVAREDDVSENASASSPPNEDDELQAHIDSIECEKLIRAIAWGYENFNLWSQDQQSQYPHPNTHALAHADDMHSYDEATLKALASTRNARAIAMLAARYQYANRPEADSHPSISLYREAAMLGHFGSLLQLKDIFSRFARKAKQKKQQEQFEYYSEKVLIWSTIIKIRGGSIYGAFGEGPFKELSKDLSEDFIDNAVIQGELIYQRFVDTRNELGLEPFDNGPEDWGVDHERSKVFDQEEMVRRAEIKCGPLET